MSKQHKITTSQTNTIKLQKKKKIRHKNGGKSVWSSV